ncbi:MAG: thermonuclease family protein [Rhodospirillaceae bacterium]|jgi:micrococcal nuclease|nr:thermonuclease family protein [Rhodospirillaceae bacterium]MBT5240469.1 thermonuclease family protein [Rhodospirillaceae bacterium]MBT5564966.1 thermonuclease family protein [Rhodospirillaceae bacterium]MBT6090492.1 thermonuclease family protein [Rhodospirillaceae bacterium]MBT6961688.1 thermonuclease family protein [Rhodospirillaceae bacterium]
MVRVFLVLVTSVFVSAAYGADVVSIQLASPLELKAAAQNSVVSVIDGDTLVLEDGQEVRLTGIQAPKLPLGRRNFPTWPLASDADVALEGLAVGQVVGLYIDGNGQDRHRRILAHVVNENGVWLQLRMIELGMARVYTFSDNRRLAAALLVAERAARKTRKGIWSLDYYAVRSADPSTLARDFGTFQLIEGTVSDVAKVRSRIYLNFGDDYRTDFTISIDRAAWPLFEEVGLDPLSLAHRSVRVRGWVKDFNGPLVDVTHPEQIEILP